MGMRSVNLTHTADAGKWARARAHRPSRCRSAYVSDPAGASSMFLSSFHEEAHLVMERCRGAGQGALLPSSLCIVMGVVAGW